MCGHKDIATVYCMTVSGPGLNSTVANASSLQHFKWKWTLTQGGMRGDHGINRGQKKLVSPQLETAKYQNKQLEALFVCLFD